MCEKGKIGLPDGQSASDRRDQPLVTFALLAYNQENYIREAVNGAFSQTYNPLEIILSDDCSTDRTFEIMQEMAAKYHGPHRIILERNPRNLGRDRFGLRIWSLLKKTNGEFIICADGDDISKEERCQTLFDLWTSKGRPKVSIHSFAEVIDDVGRFIGLRVGSNEIASIPLKELVRIDGRGLLGATHAISRSLIDNFCPLPDELLLDDGALAFRARLCDGILFSPHTLVLYRRHSQNATNGSELNDAAAFDKYIRALIGQHRGFLGDYARHAKSLDVDVINSIYNRLRAVDEMSYLFTNKISKRIKAILTYSERLPKKRRLWLTLRVLGLVGTSDALPPIS